MKRRKLKPFVIPTLCILLLGTIFYSGYRIWEILNYDQNIIPTNPVSNNLRIDEVLPTISTQDTIIKPYNDSNVKVTIPYYNINGSDTEQQEALIYYENIYMENTGIMYTSSDTFNIYAVLDGTVKSIKDDEIMGKIIEIETNKKITTIYQSVDNVTIKEGDKVKQGDIIATSGKNKITNDLYALHFEVYKEGFIINPEEFYNMSIEDIYE